MSEREIIRQISISAEIYDLDLAQKVNRAVAEDMPTVGPDLLFGLDIVFNMSVYQNKEFYQYPLSKELKGPQPTTDREKMAQKISNVLGEQLDRVIEALEQNGFRFGRTAIIGDKTGSNHIQVTLYREAPPEKPQGRKQTSFRVNCIMPDRPYVTEQAAKFFVEMIKKQIQDGTFEKLARRNHTPNWVSADRLFSAIANSLHSDSVEATIAKDKLIKKAYMSSDWPLYLRSKTRNDDAAPMTGETQIDCPEYFLFRLNSGGSWEIKKVEGLKEAQQSISKHGFTSKWTKSVVVLHNLEPVPYTLFAETDEGLTVVSPEEAHGYKKLHVSWNKK